MLSPNVVKLIFVCAALLISACGFWQSKTAATPPFAAEEIKSDVPFSTKEPAVYQTEIVVTTGGIENKTFIARSGANQLTIFDYQKKSEYALLKISSQNFLISRSRKIYAENESAGIGSADTGETLSAFLTNEWLNQKNDAKFEKIGAENNLTTYRIKLNDSARSEIIISVDEKIGLPVKQEFYSASGERETLTLAIEFKNFSAQTDASFFAVPKDYKKVSAKEFQETLRRARAKEND